MHREVERVNGRRFQGHEAYYLRSQKISGMRRRPQSSPFCHSSRFFHQRVSLYTSTVAHSQRGSLWCRLQLAMCVAGEALLISTLIGQLPLEERPSQAPSLPYKPLPQANGAPLHQPLALRQRFCIYSLSLSILSSYTGSFVVMPGLVIAASIRNVRQLCLRLRLTAYDLIPEED